MVDTLIQEPTVTVYVWLPENEILVLALFLLLIFVIARFGLKLVPFIG